MKPLLSAHPARLSAVVLAIALLGGCSTINEIFAGDKVDYRSSGTANKGKVLDVPPDLTQLARDSRFQNQGGVVSAAASTGAAVRPAPGAAAASTVALTSQGDARIERQGSQRWLVLGASPEQVWPQLKAFWAERGFVLTTDSAETGVMETDWAENRAKLPNDMIRSTLGRFIDGLYDTGVRDRFRTRVERGVNGGSEIYISHRGLEESFTSERKETTAWRPRDNDPQLEAQMLSALMVRLGTKEEVARTAVATAAEQPARARLVSGTAAATLEVDEGFDRAWRRVGLALDRTGFSVEDRDRTAGIYYVRYVDPRGPGGAEPGFFTKLFSSGASAAPPVKYRVAVAKGTTDKTLVSVQTSAGAPEAGEPGQRIVTLLLPELK